jgi:HSP20 family protein
MFFVPMTRDSRQLSRLFDDTFERFLGPVAGGEGGLAAPDTRSPALDVAESERSYTVKLEMPGVAKDDVKVSIDGRHVTVLAQTQQTDEKKEGDRVVYRERSCSSYARTFSLPVEVDQSESGARLEHGVLTLTLPKRGARTAARITVN